MKKLVVLLVIAGFFTVFSLVRYAKDSINHINVDKVTLNPDHVNAKRINLNELIAAYKGEEKAEILKKLSIDLLPDERAIFVDEVVNVVKSDDEISTLAVLKNISKLKLKKEEFELISKNVLELKNKRLFMDNWSEIQKSFILVGITI